MQKLVDEIRQIYATDHLQAEAGIETYLETRLRSFPLNKKIALLEKLTKEFNDSPANDATDATIEDEVLSRLFSLVLGGKVANFDISSAELLQRLAESLNTIFDKLNQLVGLINSTFHGQTSGEETIRQVIGFHLESEEQLKSLESYLGQINNAFLLTREAFKKAATKTVSTILSELDPDRIDQATESGLKFGPLRKAELFEIYENKYKICRDWFESGRFIESFLREFEKNCQQRPL
jgi:hypothetical protein